MKKVKLSIIKILLAAAGVLALVFVIWVIASRPASRTVEIEKRVLKEIKGDYKEADVAGEPVKVADDGKNVLYFEQSTGGLILEDRKTGEKIYGVPADAANDVKATGNDTKKELGSTLLLTYYDIKTQKTVVFDSLTNAAALNQIYYAPLKDGSGVGVKLVLGREDAARLIPEQISAERFDALLADVEAASGSSVAKKVKALYLNYTMEKATAEQKQKFPALQKTDIYVLKSSATKRNKENLEKYFKESGYTYEQMEKDYAELDYVSEAEQFPCFRVKMEYMLEDGALKVNIPADEIEYDKDAFILTQLRIFPFMGAGKVGEEGYVFVPDGSGALVPFNNDGRIASVYTANRMYGPDGAEAKIDRGSTYYEYRNPVFGVKTGEHAVFGIVTDGDATTMICNQVGNITHSYNTAYATFIISQNAQYESYTMEQAPWIQYDRNGYQGMISLNYYLLTGDDADYVGMAKIYRDYILSKREGKNEGKTASGLPIYIETLGTVGNNTRVLGIPGYRNVEVTSYDEAAEMLKELTSLGVSNIKFRYLAWCNNGFYTGVPTGIDLEKKVGSKRDLKALEKVADELGSELFMDINVLTAARHGKYDPGFIISSDGIRDLFQKQSYYPHFNPTMEIVKGWKYCMNPKKVLSYFEKMTKDYDKLNVGSISLSDLGTVLNSNYKRSDYTNRQESLEIMKEVMKRADERYDSVLVEEGNAYTLAYADHILGLPVSNSSYSVELKSVPFIQIALHGIADYAGEPLNVSASYEDELLKSIEYGCAPYFRLCDADGSILKKSFIVEEDLYDVDYDKWKTEVARVYAEMDNVLGKVTDAFITDHEEIAGGLFVTSYDNGYRIVVNYNEKDAVYEGQTISAKGYAVLKGVNTNE